MTFKYYVDTLTISSHITFTFPFHPSPLDSVRHRNCLIVVSALHSYIIHTETRTWCGTTNPVMIIYQSGLSPSSDTYFSINKHSARPTGFVRSVVPNCRVWPDSPDAIQITRMSPLVVLTIPLVDWFWLFGASVERDRGRRELIYCTLSVGLLN